MKHYTIPFFIPHEGCPFDCVFCSQKKISGRARSASYSDIPRTISRYLKTIPDKKARIEVAFFGGSFTGLPLNRQERYLKSVQPFIIKKAIHGIRISTRPDFIDPDILKMMKKYHVRSIELGVQSLSDDVLAAAKRGHTASDVRKASELIIKNGFVLGHQLMVGLPKSTLAKEIKTAGMSIAMKATEARIYPVVVIRGTGLAAMYNKGSYAPLTEKQAIARSARLVAIFRKNRVSVLRCGLHPSPGLLTGDEIISGPFHQAFGQKVETYLYGEMFDNVFEKIKDPGSIRRILYNPTDGASVIGYDRVNAERIERLVNKRGIFKEERVVRKGSVIIEHINGRRKTLRAV